MNRSECATRSEYSANLELQESVRTVEQGANWMVPARNVRIASSPWYIRLIRLIVGH